MLFKLVIAALLIGIVVSLFSGLLFLLKDKSDSRRTVRWRPGRVELSLTLFGLLVIGGKLGWIQPHGLNR